MKIYQKSSLNTITVYEPNVYVLKYGFNRNIP